MKIPDRAAVCIIVLSFFITSCYSKTMKLTDDQIPTIPRPSALIQKPHTDMIAQSFVIGDSVQKRPLSVTRIGLGIKRAIVFLGCIHGTEKNTKELLDILLDDYAQNPGKIPDTHTLFFLPLVNPDGFFLNTRENEHGVDLNCNFPTHDWVSDAYSMTDVFTGIGGTAPGSEPEVKAVTGFLTYFVQPLYKEVYVLSFHSACPPHGYIQPGYYKNGTPDFESAQIAKPAAQSAGYKYLHSWTRNPPITGELIHYCADNGMVSMDVELPAYDKPDSIPKGKKETTLDSLGRMVQYVIEME